MSWLEIIGAIAVGIFCLLACILLIEIVREAVRAFRQTCRIGRVLKGHDWRRRVTIRQFARGWRQEFYSSYSTLQFGGIELPHNPSKRIRHRYYG